MIVVVVSVAVKLDEELLLVDEVSVEVAVFDVVEVVVVDSV